MFGRWALVWLAGCGRIGFDAGQATVVDDGSVVDDAPVEDGMVLVPTPGVFDFQLVTPPATWKQVTLSRSFLLDRDEVTVGRFKAWLAAGRPVPCTAATADAAGMCPLDPTGHYDMGWRIAWNDSVLQGDFAYTSCARTWGFDAATVGSGVDSFPANCVTWQQAAAFCAWDGRKRLPTQVEWNLAARAATHRRYVWGDQVPTCQHAVFNAGGTFCGFPAMVGSTPLGTSANGARDLSGSVWEWLWDPSPQQDFKPTSDDVPANSVDYAGVASLVDVGQAHVLAGGEFGWGEDRLDLLVAGGNGPGVAWTGKSMVDTIGFRCARTAP